VVNNLKGVCEVGGEILPSAPPTDYDTVFVSPFEASERSKGHFQKTCFVTFDQPLFFKAREIVEGGQHSELSCMVVRLGEFHLLMSFMGCIGAIMADCRELLEGAIYAYLYRSQAWTRC
jgi:hypothetical protein